MTRNPVRREAVAPLADLGSIAPLELSLPAGLALDIAMSELGRDPEPNEQLLALCRPEARHAIAARWPGPIEFQPHDEMPAAEARPPGTRPRAQFASAVWLAPTAASWRSDAAALNARLASGARVAIVGRGPLLALLSTVRPAQPPLSAGTIDPRRVVRELGYPELQVRHAYGLRSVVWAALRVFADRLGRPDLADRFEAAFRDALLDHPGSRSSCLRISFARKPGFA